jgi:hypothetical protein
MAGRMVCRKRSSRDGRCGACVPACMYFENPSSARINHTKHRKRWLCYTGVRVVCAPSWRDFERGIARGARSYIEKSESSSDQSNDTNKDGCFGTKNPNPVRTKVGVGSFSVIPAKAGTQRLWIPAFARMTTRAGHRNPLFRIQLGSKPRTSRMWFRRSAFPGATGSDWSRPEGRSYRPGNQECGNVKNPSSARI